MQEADSPGGVGPSGSHKPGPGSSSQALTAGGGAGPVVHIQSAEPQVAALCRAPLGPQHPRVCRDLVQRGPLRGPQGQTPLNELLALCGEDGQSQEGTGSSLLRLLGSQHSPGSARRASPAPTTHLGRFSSGRRGGLGESPRPARRECPHTPYHRAVRPETTPLPSARGSGGSGSIQGGCIPGCLGGGGTRALGRPPQGPAPSPALSLSPCEARAGSRPPEILLVITLEKPGGCGLPSWPARPGEGRVT